MKRIFYTSLVARILLALGGCHTITLGAFIFTKRTKERTTAATVNHECTHIRQWCEMTFVADILLYILHLTIGLSGLWLLASVLFFYLWYALKWLVRLIVFLSALTAYKTVSLEQEAYKNEEDDRYNNTCGYFCFLKYLGKGE